MPPETAIIDPDSSLFLVIDKIFEPTLSVIPYDSFDDASPFTPFKKKLLDWQFKRGKQ